MFYNNFDNPVYIHPSNRTQEILKNFHNKFGNPVHLHPSSRTQQILQNFQNTLYVFKLGRKHLFH